MKNSDTKLVSARAAGAARLSIACGLLFVLLLASLHVLEPEFDPTRRFLSEYALGRVGWMMNLAFLALAFSLACAGMAIFKLRNARKVDQREAAASGTVGALQGAQ